MGLNILFEDTHLLVLYKPAGVPVQSARVGTKDCESMLKNYLYENTLRGSANTQKGAPYLGVVHRLDQPVEGLLVFAKTPEAAAHLNRQVQEGQMKKTYLAVRETVDKSAENIGKSRHNCGKMVKNVEKPVENWTEITDFLKKNGRENTSMIVKPGTVGAKKAVLRYRVLETAESMELVEIQLLTGRHHQIRVQMAGQGTPLVGDGKYGRALKNVDTVDKSYPALCAYRLEFIHPKTGKPLSFEIKPENALFSSF